MAIVKSGLFSKLQGSVSGVTFRARANGRIELGQKHKPADPQSTAQLNSRAGYTQLMKVYAESAWVDITQYDRLAELTDISAWNAFVKRHQRGIKRNPTTYWGIAETSALVQIHDFQGVHDSIAQAYTPKQYGPAAVSICGFDDAADHLTFADHDDLDIQATDDVYIACWCKIAADSQSKFICAKVDLVPANRRGYQVSISTSGKMTFWIFDDTKPAGNWPFKIQYTGNIKDGVWHYLEFVRDRAALKGYIYIDGVLVAEDTDSTTLTSANTENLIIGNRWDLTQGLLGDMRNITLDIG